jgi:hypothetical protein
MFFIQRYQLSDHNKDSNQRYVNQQRLSVSINLNYILHGFSKVYFLNQNF